MQSRRDFLRLLGLAVGATLSGCGSSGDQTFATSGSGGGSPTPLAYRYVKLIKSGDPLPGGARLALSLASTGDAPPPFMGAVMLTDSRHIYFHALDEIQTRGIYRIDVDADGARSEVTSVIREGDILADGSVVQDFSDGDVNNNDDFVVTTENSQGTYNLRYAAGGGAFSSLSKSGGTLGSVKLAEDIDQSQSVADDGSILFVAEFMDDAGDCQGEGLFFMPKGRPDQTQRLLAKGDLLPGTSSVIETFGAVEIVSGGVYLAQGSARPATGANTSGRPLTFLLRGTVGQTPQLLAVDGLLGTTSGALQTSVFMCPRLSPEGATCFISQSSRGDQTQLWFADPGGRPRFVMRADITGVSGLQTQRSPRGAIVLSLLPPVFGPNGLVYFEVFTNQGMEIVLWDGATFQTLLARGDVVDGKKVETIVFGALPDCVNANGEFAAIVEFDDGETDVYLGMPV